MAKKFVLILVIGDNPLNVPSGTTAFQSIQTLFHEEHLWLNIYNFHNSSHYCLNEAGRPNSEENKKIAQNILLSKS